MSVNGKASPREKLSRTATDEGSRKAAWNERYQNAEHKDLIRLTSVTTSRSTFPKGKA